MPSSAFQQPVSSRPTVDFLEALATNAASATVSLALATRNPFWFIRAISLVALENLDYEIQFYSKASNLGGTFTTDNFVGLWQFAAMTATVPASPGYPVDPVDSSPADPYYHFYIDGLAIPYFDADQLAAANAANSGGTYPNNAHLHCRLVNRSTAAKTAGANGAVKLTVFLAPQGMQV